MQIEEYQKTIIWNEEHIFVKPLYDFFGIDYKNQRKVINNDYILKSNAFKKRSEFIFGDKRERLCLSKKGFIRWVQLLPPSIVDTKLQEKFKSFQVSIFDYLYGENLEREINRKLTSTKYIRLKKMKRLYSHLGHEIRRLTADLNTNLEKIFVQGSIPFSENPKQLNK